MPPDLTFSRLALDDSDEAARFLNLVWGAQYGPMGVPTFTEPYLRWLYGGPDQVRHIVVACHLNGRLAGLRAMLHRLVSFQGRVWTAYLTTHLAIHPELGRPMRSEVRDRILDSSSLCVDRSSAAAADARDVLVSFFEESKHALLQRIAQKGLEHGIGTRVSAFNHAVVTPKVLQARARDAQRHDSRVRTIDDRDIPELTRLFNSVAAEQPFALTMSDATLGHHMFGLPGGRSYLVEERSVPSGFIVFYPMEIVKSSVPLRVILVDFLVTAGSRDGACLLLEEALAHARRADARGVVIENPTYLDAETQRFCGIAPSPRRVLIATRSRLQPFECGGRFLCDVK